MQIKELPNADGGAVRTIEVWDSQPVLLKEAIHAVEGAGYRRDLTTEPRLISGSFRQSWGIPVCTEDETL